MSISQTYLFSKCLSILFHWELYRQNCKLFFSAPLYTLLVFNLKITFATQNQLLNTSAYPDPIIGLYLLSINPTVFPRLFYYFCTTLLVWVLASHNLFYPQYQRKTTADCVNLVLKRRWLMSNTNGPLCIFWTTPSYFNINHWSKRGQIHFMCFYYTPLPSLSFPKRYIRSQFLHSFILMWQILYQTGCKSVIY